MGRPRKTIKVQDLKERINRMIASATTTEDARNILALLATSVLMDTHNYRGFNYIAWVDEGGYERWVEDGKPDDNRPYLGDQTRVFFY